MIRVVIRQHLFNLHLQTPSLVWDLTKGQLSQHKNRPAHLQPVLYRIDPACMMIAAYCRLSCASQVTRRLDHMACIRTTELNLNFGAHLCKADFQALYKVLCTEQTHGSRHQDDTTNPSAVALAATAVVAAAADGGGGSSGGAVLGLLAQDDVLIRSGVEALLSLVR